MLESIRVREIVDITAFISSSLLIMFAVNLSIWHMDKPLLAKNYITKDVPVSNYDFNSKRIKRVNKRIKILFIQESKESSSQGLKNITFELDYAISHSINHLLLNDSEYRLMNIESVSKLPEYEGIKNTFIKYTESLGYFAEPYAHDNTKWRISPQEDK